MAKALPISGLDTSGPIFDNIRVIVETRLGEMISYEPFIDDVERVYELHQMRIAAKRLRYTMEMFQPLLQKHSCHVNEYSEVIDRVKALQEHLGEIHDADVLVPRLEEHAARLLKPACGKDKHGAPRVGVDLADIDGCQGILRICADVRRERAARYRGLQRDWALYRKKRVFEKLRDLLAEAAKTNAPSERIEAEE